MGEVLDLAPHVGEAQQVPEAVQEFKENCLKGVVGKYIGEVYHPKFTDIKATALTGREYRGVLLPKGLGGEEIQAIMKHKPCLEVDVRRVQAMANYAEKPEDAAFMEVSLRLDVARVAAAQFAAVVDCPTRDIATLPAKLDRFKNAGAVERFCRYERFAS